MPDQSHLELFFQGLVSWNEWRDEHPEIRPDLREAYLSGSEIEETALSDTSIGAFLPRIDFSHADLAHIRLEYASLYGAYFNDSDLSGASLSDADFSYANLNGASLSGASLYSANLTDADLSDADLSGASLNKANLSGANLRGARLTGADLSGAVFNATTLADVDLHGATLGWTVFANVDLSSVHGLETVKHAGPSTIGMDTLIRSGGTLPASFLFHCGMDHDLIQAFQQQVDQKAEIPTCSIGYTLADEGFAEKLIGWVHAQDTPCWPVALDIPGGIPRPTRATSYTERYSILVLVLSQKVIESEDIPQEVATAWQMEVKQQRQILFPIYIDEKVLTAPADWLALLRRGRTLLNFTQWRDEEAYQASLKRLVHALHTSQEVSSEESASNMSALSWRN